MKKLFCAVAALLLAVASFGADETTSVKYVTRTFDYKDFTALSLSGVVKVNLSKSDTYSVSVSLPDVLEEYLAVKVSNGTLRLGLENVPSKITRKLNSWTFTAEVSMPVLRALYMSGATKLECADSFNIGSSTFKMDISGASKLSSLSVTGGSLDVDMSGATSARLDGSFLDAKFDLSGAAKGVFVFDAGKLDIDMTGASKAEITGDYSAVLVDASGAADLHLSGSAEKASIDASGAAKIRTFDSQMVTAKVSSSGASRCEVNVSEDLRIEASGASGVKYKDNSGLRVDLVSISRGASVGRVQR